MEKSEILQLASKTVLVVLFIAGVVIIWAFTGKKSEPGRETKVVHNEWSKSSVIYEVNIRQYTPEGTLKAFEKQLPRLKEMGVDILWLMPINPIGSLNRKGTLGSYYSIKDYLAVNPEYGTMEDFKNLVKKIHQLGMKVIIDWVANHTSWDNDLIRQHPEWYTHDADGKIIAPVKDWTDVADLDYDKPELREYMKNALAFWVEKADVDGFRCDVAGMVPIDFWNNAMPQVEKIKPLFMLAEDEGPNMHDVAFDMTYSWEVYHLMSEIYKGRKTAAQFDSLFEKEKVDFAPDAYRMRFTSNHDENSWNGTEYERLGEGAQTFAVLSFMIPGMPLIYSGQESAMNKRLGFFDKDTISWEGYNLASFYSLLIRTKKENPALWNGEAGGNLKKIHSNNDNYIYAFSREKEGNKIIAIFNLSAASQPLKIEVKDLAGKYQNMITGDTETIGETITAMMNPWEYRIFIRK